MRFRTGLMQGFRCVTLCFLGSVVACDGGDEVCYFNRTQAFYEYCSGGARISLLFAESAGGGRQIFFSDNLGGDFIWTLENDRTLTSTNCRPVRIGYLEARDGFLGRVRMVDGGLVLEDWSQYFEEVWQFFHYKNPRGGDGTGLYRFDDRPRFRELELCKTLEYDKFRIRADSFNSDPKCNTN